MEYANNKPAYDKGTQTYYTALYPCFCDRKTTVMTKKYSAHGAKDNFGKVPPTTDICMKYTSIKMTGLAVESSISFVIIAINLVLKKIVIKLLTEVKEATKSEMLASITNGVFITLYLNTGFLLTVANANLTEHPPHFITKFFTGPYYDYDPNWYP